VVVLSFLILNTACRISHILDVSSGAKRGTCSATADEELLRLHYVQQIPPAIHRDFQQVAEARFRTQNKLLEGFTARYSFDMLVYYEEFSNVHAAIDREKELKGWREKRS
jgi:hypothetical protein